tara:strand:+ start:192 stop:383 length:192 start_codon:yes stop_codon:yes gene_type:complete
MAIIDQTREDAEETANASRPYNEKRLLAYPTIGDQLDDLYKANVFSAEMTALIAAVKTAHPKP